MQANDNRGWADAEFRDQPRTTSRCGGVRHDGAGVCGRRCGCGGCGYRRGGSTSCQGSRASLDGVGLDLCHRRRFRRSLQSRRDCGLTAEATLSLEAPLPLLDRPVHRSESEPLSSFVRCLVWRPRPVSQRRISPPAPALGFEVVLTITVGDGDPRARPTVIGSSALMLPSPSVRRSPCVGWLPCRSRAHP